MKPCNLSLTQYRVYGMFLALFLAGQCLFGITPSEKNAWSVAHDGRIELEHRWRTNMEIDLDLPTNKIQDTAEARRWLDNWDSWKARCDQRIANWASIAKGFSLLARLWGDLADSIYSGGDHANSRKATVLQEEALKSASMARRNQRIDENNLANQATYKNQIQQYYETKTIAPVPLDPDTEIMKRWVPGLQAGTRTLTESQVDFVIRLTGRGEGPLATAQNNLPNFGQRLLAVSILTLCPSSQSLAVLGRVAAFEEDLLIAPTASAWLRDEGSPAARAALAEALQASRVHSVWADAVLVLGRKPQADDQLAMFQAASKFRNELDPLADQLFFAAFLRAADGWSQVLTEKESRSELAEVLIKSLVDKRFPKKLTHPALEPFLEELNPFLQTDTAVMQIVTKLNTKR